MNTANTTTKLTPLEMGPRIVSEQGKKYKLYNGIYYHIDTSHAAINALDVARTHGQTIRLWYGDVKTGIAWPEENDVYGRIGNSTGQIKVPLIVHPNSQGGPQLLEDCIVAIKTSTYYLYKHQYFTTGKWEIDPQDKTQTKVLHNGKHYSTHKSPLAAKRFMYFMQGKRMTK